MTEFWPHLLPVLAFALALGTSLHAVLHKRDVRAALGWVGLIWLVPLIGVTLYTLLGVNRIERKARILRARQDPKVEASAPRSRGDLDVRAEPLPALSLDSTLLPALDDEEAETALGHLGALERMCRRITARPLLSGNLIRALSGGDAAYDEMLSAIDAARTSIALVTYIFDYDAAGERFVAALGRAAARGVQVRVLVDAVGARYSRSRVDRHLRKAGVPVALFLPAFAPGLTPFFNLRNHRKALVVDGTLGFAGGMNIRAGNLSASSPRRAVRDMHFLLQGPVVHQLQEAFVQDWLFTTREVLEGAVWFPRSSAAGSTFARVIKDGPDEDFEKMRWAFLAGLACAARSIQIMTPYFLPDASLISALNVAALRGVDVRIVVPERSNIPLADWAMWGQLRQMTEYGCQFFFSHPPFEHTKLMIVDERWVVIGSANWDARSLRLNFELGVEIYDLALAAEMTRYIRERCELGVALAPERIRDRRLLLRVRDGLARLLLPYL